MPWTCPSCRQPIQHKTREPMPRPATTYRCHVCRLDPVFDAIRQKLNAFDDEGTPAGFEVDNADGPPTSFAPTGRMPVCNSNETHVTRRRGLDIREASLEQGFDERSAPEQTESGRDAS